MCNYVKIQIMFKIHVHATRQLYITFFSTGDIYFDFIYIISILIVCSLIQLFQQVNAFDLFAYFYFLIFMLNKRLHYSDILLSLQIKLCGVIFNHINIAQSVIKLEVLSFPFSA